MRRTSGGTRFGGTQSRELLGVDDSPRHHAPANGARPLLGHALRASGRAIGCVQVWRRFVRPGREVELAHGPLSMPHARGRPAARRFPHASGRPRGPRGTLAPCRTVEVEARVDPAAGDGGRRIQAQRRLRAPRRRASPARAVPRREGVPGPASVPGASVSAPAARPGSDAQGNRQKDVPVPVMRAPTIRQDRGPARKVPRATTPPGPGIAPCSRRAPGGRCAPIQAAAARPAPGGEEEARGLGQGARTRRRAASRSARKGAMDASSAGSSRKSVWRAQA
jgi:hypothetical protein